MNGLLEMHKKLKKCLPVFDPINHLTDRKPCSLDKS